jgi:hypothetical protein
MRYKKGSPKTIYAVTWQDTGDVMAYTNTRDRAADMRGEDVTKFVFATYDLREIK